jgi:hypothetical protein
VGLQVGMVKHLQPILMLALLVSKLLTKFLGHKELRNAKNEKGGSERGKKPLWTVVAKVVKTEPDEGHA